MSETYLVLVLGAIAGLAGALIGGILLYRYRLRNHLRLQEKIDEERTALYEEVSEITKEELGLTDAGKDLLALSQASIQQFGYPRANVTTSLRRQNYDLLKQIDEYRKKLAQSEERLTAVAASQQESEKVIVNLKLDNNELRLANSVPDSTTSTNFGQIEQDLRITLEEVARLQNQLAESNMRLIEVEAGGIGAFARELHRTLSDTLQSIDLLLDDSVGTLNPMQRNLLETMKASTARLNSVIEDFVQVTTFKANSHAPVELSSVVQDAIAETSSQVRAKRITLNVHLPENVAPIDADREALQQILIRLLSNAGAASPLQGTVQLRIQTNEKDDKEYILIQVSDTGGGIPREDLHRVFTPLYRTDDVSARGVGEPGMGLFIVKTLTEAQNGRIWVDTEPGVGSTYNVLIPIARDISANLSTDEQNHEEE